MIWAQGYRLAAADVAALVEQRDARRAETGVSLKAITIPVIDPTTGARIGGLRYEF